jgi:hypothetical protein
MDLAFAVLYITTGLLVLVFARDVANAMNFLAGVVGELLPQWRWPTTLPPGSRESFENRLWFTRLWAACLLAVGLVLLGA